MNYVRCFICGVIGVDDDKNFPSLKITSDMSTWICNSCVEKPKSLNTSGDSV